MRRASTDTVISDCVDLLLRTNWWLCNVYNVTKNLPCGL